jgi:hypothetical protein
MRRPMTLAPSHVLLGFQGSSQRTLRRAGALPAFPCTEEYIAQLGLWFLVYAGLNHQVHLLRM